MKTSLRAITVTSALFWGGCMLLVGLINLADASYGGEFLRVMSSIYPGADTTRSIGRVLIGAAYGLVDGAVGAYLFVLFYRLITREHRSVH